jgi:hypothetical protein
MSLRSTERPPAAASPVVGVAWLGEGVAVVSSSAVPDAGALYHAEVYRKPRSTHGLRLRPPCRTVTR